MAKNNSKKDPSIEDLEEQIKLIQEKLKDYDYKQESKIAYENLMYESKQRFCTQGQVWDKALGKCVPKDTSAPKVYAGPDVTVFIGTTVTLAGSATDNDNNIKKMSWTQTGGKTVQLTPSADGTTAKFTAQHEGVYNFTFTAIDTDGLSGSDSINVVSLKQVPTGSFKVNAGQDRTVKVQSFPTVIQLAGKITGNTSILNFGWTGLPSIPKSLTPQVVIPAAGNYDVVLSATSVKGDTESDTVKITAEKTTVEPPKCPPGQKYDEILKKCVPDVPLPCPPGQHRNEQGICVPDNTGNDIDPFGMKILLKPTGKKVAMEEGTDHRNGKRYNVNHKFHNYIMQGYYKLGQGQDAINHKGDGPNHGGCSDSKICLWYEFHVDLPDGKFSLQYENPHPDNHNVPDNKLEHVKTIGKLSAGKWIGWATAYYWGKDGFRHMKAYIDPNPFPNNDPTQKPNNSWIEGIYAVERGQICSTIKHPRNLQEVIDHDAGFESEIRMNNGTNGDTQMKNAFVFEITAPDVDQPPPPPPDDSVDAKFPELLAKAQIGSTFVLDGSQSTGNITNWKIEQVEGPTVTLVNNPKKYSKQFVMPNAKVQFTLTVSNATKSNSDTITVNPVTDLPPPPTGDLLWDSNIHGKWNNGVKRTVTDTEGNQNPDGKGYHTAASGNPELIVDGNGVAHLKADAGHGRIYVKALNYNARLEFDYMFEDTNIDNISFKLRSRHGEGSDCQNRFGGFGGAIGRADGEIDFQTESCHNNHENKIAAPIPAHTVGKWYRAAISVWDAPDKKHVNLKAEIDYKDGNGFKQVLIGKHDNPQSYYVDEATFMKSSYFWLRINNEKTGQVAFKDVKLTKI